MVRKSSAGHFLNRNLYQGKWDCPHSLQVQGKEFRSLPALPSGTRGKQEMPKRYHGSRLSSSHGRAAMVQGHKGQCSVRSQNITHWDGPTGTKTDRHSLQRAGKMDKVWGNIHHFGISSLQPPYNHAQPFNSVSTASRLPNHEH